MNINTCKGLLCNVLNPLQQSRRFRGKINIRRPQLPHFERAKYLEITKPFYAPKKSILPEFELCSNKKVRKNVEEKNPYQEILAAEIKHHFYASPMIGFFHRNSVDSAENMDIKVLCFKQNMHFSQFGKKTLQQAIGETPFAQAVELFVSHSQVIFCRDANVKNLLKIQKKHPSFVLLAGIVHGRLLSKDELIKYSNIPNIQTAQVGLVQVLEAMGNQVVTHLNTHQTTLLSQLEERTRQLKTE